METTNKPEGLARDQLYVYGRINSSWANYSNDFLYGRTQLTSDAGFGDGLWVWWVFSLYSYICPVAGYSGILRDSNTNSRNKCFTDWVGTGGNLGLQKEVFNLY